MSRPFSAPSMQAITLHQPWAWAFARAGKLIENREWAPGLKTGEPVAIHAGLTIELDLWTGAESGSATEEKADDGWMFWPVGRAEPPAPSAFVRLQDPGGYRIAPDPPDAATALGAIVAVATFAQVISQPPRKNYQADWRTGTRYGWLFSRCEPLAMPVPCRGGRKLWRLPAAVNEQVLELWYRDLM